MTYFGFLFRFLTIPLILFLTVAVLDERRGKTIPGFRNGRMVWMAIGLHVVLAVLYTTPWDNYLVATGVWRYDPDLVSGLFFGWVPLEEYIFFVLETILTGLWWWFLARRLSPPGEFKPSKYIRITSLVALGLVWLGAVYLLIADWKPGAYLALILAWALPPIALQLAFGADILWHHRKLVSLTVLPAFLYLSVTDSLAIASGTWMIDPMQTTGLFLGTLPIEEAVFFLVTVMLIGFGLTLTLAHLSKARWSSWMSSRLAGRMGNDQGK